MLNISCCAQSVLVRIWTSTSADILTTRTAIGQFQGSIPALAVGRDVPRREPPAVPAISGEQFLVHWGGALMTNVPAAQYLRYPLNVRSIQSIVKAHGLQTTHSKMASRSVKPLVTRPRAAWKLGEGQDCRNSFRMSLGESNPIRRFSCMT